MTQERVPWGDLHIADRILLAATICIGLMGFLFLADLVTAYGSQSCVEAVSADCYPWGSEGPSAGDWEYTNKTNYIVSGVLHLLLVFGIIGAAYPLLIKRKLSLRRRWLALVLIAGLAATLAL